MRGPRCLAERVPCVADTPTEREIAERRGAGRQGAGELHRQRPDLMTTRSIAGQRACLRAVTKAVRKRVELHTPLLANLFHEPRKGLRFVCHTQKSVREGDPSQT